MRRTPDGVVLYYLATPLFGVADLVFHAPVRLSSVLPEDARLAYYAAVFFLGVICLLRSGATPWVGMLESSGNLLILLLAILLPIWNLPLILAEGGDAELGLTAWSLANALVCGTALTVSFHRHRADVAGALRGRRGGTAV
ncbi:MAG TPA: hypothetical protein VLA36_09505 [Longimicrobiales bacterium]|nr:hypothetical protein [Longimicrobiales bacterium]